METNIHLFCIPYAGGTAAAFNIFNSHLDPNIRVKNVELSGKGSRIKEPLYKNLSEAVDDVFDLLKEEISDAPYMLLGHSMGAKIVYKLTEKIKQNKLPAPLHVFLSGSSAPHFRRKDEELYHLMEDEQFKNKIIALGGTPPNFFKYPELVEIFLPALKNDFKIMETAVYGEMISPLPCDISVLIGEDDDLTLDEREGWKHYTNQHCAIHYFQGGHFFFLDKTEKVVGIINRAVPLELKQDSFYSS